ncbi:hypothetical protein [Streptomyces sp. NPDC005784]|uniref:hypothetical protein n=1 Tax=Streptomyces sp. NPDC005784 TaxID=3364731 RepID=UPI0036C8678F
MPTVRTSREFQGNGPISLVALSKLEQRSFPVSVRDLIAIRTKTIQSRTSAGDVDADVTFAFASSGGWTASVSVHDNGTITGDSFVLDLTLNGIPNNAGTRFTGELHTDETTQQSKNGIDPNIRAHFDQITSLHVKLQATPDVESVISDIGLFLVTAGTIAFLTAPGKVQAGPCTNPDQPDCVQFTKVQGGGPSDPSGDPTAGGTIGRA